MEEKVHRRANGFRIACTWRRTCRWPCRQCTRRGGLRRTTCTPCTSPNGYGVLSMDYSRMTYAHARTHLCIHTHTCTHMYAHALSSNLALCTCADRLNHPSCNLFFISGEHLPVFVWVRSHAAAAVAARGLGLRHVACGNWGKLQSRVNFTTTSYKTDMMAYDSFYACNE